MLIIDASKHFLKVGKNNKLQASDIKRITDAVINRESNLKFSKVVSKATLRENDYNLNIPRYVDSADDAETWDLHATMLGGIPINEINQLDSYWQAFPQLRDALFNQSAARLIRQSLPLRPMKLKTPLPNTQRSTPSLNTMPKPLWVLMAIYKRN